MNKKIVFLSGLLGFGLLLSNVVNADLRVFACEPEWASLAAEIGGEHIKAHSATHARQDPHYIEARPSLIAKVRKADLVICTGAQLEIGWLTLLLNKANNPSVLPGKAGFFEASAYVQRLDIPTSVDRSQGDVHPQGNPHVQVNPHNIRHIAVALGARMSEIDTENSSNYEANLQDFLGRWDQALEAWDARALALRGKRIVVFHKSWVYLEDWLGLEEVATLEPVPGVPPTAAHLSDVLSMMEGAGEVAFIIYAPYQSHKPGQWLADRTQVPLVMLPTTVDDSDQTSDLFGLFDEILKLLLGAK